MGPVLGTLKTAASLPVNAHAAGTGTNLLFDTHGEIQRDIMIAFIFLILGLGLGELVSYVKSRLRERKEARENQQIDLSGEDWVAAWEAAVNGKIVINTERIRISQNGSSIYMRNLERSPENPIGGYLWKSNLVFSHGETLMGWYHPDKTENITSRGMMFFGYDAQRKLFYGEWVGKSYDATLCNGFVCITKNRERSLAALEQMIDLAKRHPVNVLGSVPFAA